jgi:hypothetical protein
LSATQSRRITLGLLWYHVSLRIGCASVLGKLSLGQKFIWLGWQFGLRNLRVTIPDPNNYQNYAFT